ncbi:MAG: type 12 methyltransferase [Parcubacteria group bacterium Gr01-1014_29]|nr:MAG: type 12 methyltransferase [Parcubacteria group bacterium Gr01-1014_29]
MGKARTRYYISYTTIMKTNYRISHQSERVSEIYDEVLYRPGTYDDALWQEEKRVLQRELSQLEKDVANISYLDFACGTGRLLSFLEDRVNEAVGVDIAEEMLGRARKIVHRARVIRADSTREDPLAGEVFDFITAFRFFLNAEPALREEALPKILYRLFGSSGMCKLDGALLRLPGARYIAYDLIFVCKKKSSAVG